MQTIITDKPDIKRMQSYLMWYALFARASAGRFVAAAASLLLHFCLLVRKSLTSLLCKIQRKLQFCRMSWFTSHLRHARYNWLWHMLIHKDCCLTGTQGTARVCLQVVAVADAQSHKHKDSLGSLTTCICQIWSSHRLVKGISSAPRGELLGPLHGCALGLGFISHPFSANVLNTSMVWHGCL